jgi:hypothetical protein
MKKLVIISMAALSTISAFASTNLDVHVTISDIEPIHAHMTAQNDAQNEPVNYTSHEQDGIKIDATTQESDDEHVVVKLVVSAQSSEGEYVVISEPTIVANWEEPATLTVIDGQESLEVNVVASH